MSRIDVDDLVATFSGQHIGQEQIDLATLQAQLSQTLRQYNSTATGPISMPYPMAYAQQQINTSVGYVAQSTGPHNTPTSSTPTPMQQQGWPRSRSVSQTRNNGRRNATPVDASDWDEMEEVEEELVAPEHHYHQHQHHHHHHHHSPETPYAQQSHHHHHHPNARRNPRTQASTASSYPYIPTSPPSSSNAFASSDPFYLAAQQQQQQAQHNAFLPAAPIGFAAPQVQAQYQYQGRGRWTG